MSGFITFPIKNPKYLHNLSIIDSILDDCIIGETIPQKGKFGNIDDYTSFSSDGVISFVGDAKRVMYCYPKIEYTQLKQYEKPTIVSYGLFNGYSMPIYNSDNEELFFRMRVPIEWEGNSNPFLKEIVYLSEIEDVGDKFKFQLDWINVPITGIITDVSIPCFSEITILSERNSKYSCYMISFEIDWDAPSALIPSRSNLIFGDSFNGRIRRIAASSLEVNNEIIVLDWITEWKINKIYGEDFT
jgi:hypothetical protein